ncbi:hypothetical protein ANTPLA_LOCUS2263 [Anthophora plagiata]
MVKFKWPTGRIQVQRMILLGIISVISFGILKGHMNYEKEVSEYMRSLEYRQAREAVHDYDEKQMKRNQRLLASEEAPPSSEPRQT